MMKLSLIVLAVFAWVLAASFWAAAVGVVTLNEQGVTPFFPVVILFWSAVLLGNLALKYAERFFDGVYHLIAQLINTANHNFL